MPRSKSNNKVITFFKSAISAFSAIRLIPHMFLLLFSSKKEYLWKDLDRYAENYASNIPTTTVGRLVLFVDMMTFAPEYRNVFYLRHRLPGYFLGLLCPPMHSLRIDAKICGPGLFIHHGFGTHISVEKIGSNCSIGQLVTIGFVNNSTDRPTIGDNVMIGGGARILGAVTVGDNAKVGANSVVLASVPPNATVLGIPARIIWKFSK